MKDVRVSPTSGPLRGTVRVPGDKSISHRAVLFGAMAKGVSRLSGVLDSADVRSTIGAVEALGARVSRVERHDEGLSFTVEGWGDGGPVAPQAPVDCGNSGTTVRLLMGVLAGWPVEVTLVGDASLSRRPMRRVADPLGAMGARIDTTVEGCLPALVKGGDLHGIDYLTPVASAQVKSAVLLAGVRACGTTTVREPAQSRDHTERLLPAFGVPVERIPDDRGARVSGPVVLRAADVRVPGDPSSAAFPAIAACMVPGSVVRLPGVGVNPTRTGFVTVLERMGACVDISEQSPVGAEPVGDVTVRFRDGLRATVIRATEVPGLVDEVPILAVLATACRGTTRFEGVAELRVKESDRLAAICEGLGALGASARSGADWLEIDGPVCLRGAVVDSLGDHRLAMAWAVAGLTAVEPVGIRRFDAVEVSYPGFARDLTTLGASMESFVG